MLNTKHILFAIHDIYKKIWMCWIEFLLIKFNVVLFKWCLYVWNAVTHKIHLWHKVSTSLPRNNKIKQHTVGDGSAWTMHTSCASNPSPEWIHDFSTEMSGGSEK